MPTHADTYTSSCSIILVCPPLHTAACSTLFRTNQVLLGGRRVVGDVQRLAAAGKQRVVRVQVWEGVGYLKQQLICAWRSMLN